MAAGWLVQPVTVECGVAGAAGDEIKRYIQTITVGWISRSHALWLVQPVFSFSHNQNAKLDISSKERRKLDVLHADMHALWALWLMRPEAGTADR